MLTAVDNALLQAKPEIWNRDQGNNFTSLKYFKRSTREEIKISMDGRSRAMDYIRFCNFQHPHKALDYLTRAQVHGACKPHALALETEEDGG